MLTYKDLRRIRLQGLIVYNISRILYIILIATGSYLAICKLFYKSIETNYTFLITVIICCSIGIIAGLIFLRAQRRALQEELNKILSKIDEVTPQQNEEDISEKN